MSDEDSLAVLAGGDIYEWARDQVRLDYHAARKRLGLTDPVNPTNPPPLENTQP